MESITFRTRRRLAGAAAFALLSIASAQVTALEVGQSIQVPPSGVYDYRCAIPLIGTQPTSLSLTFNAPVPFKGSEVAPIAVQGTLS